MIETLNPFQKRLLDRLQIGLPIVERPFGQIATELNAAEREVIEQTRRLKKHGYIRRLRASINYRAFGRVASLCTAKVPEDRIPKAAASINQLEGVSHNYLRDHEYNLWFTLQGDSFEEIEGILGRLSNEYDLAFHSLPAARVFKLDVRFGTENAALSQTGIAVPKVFEKPIQLSEDERKIIAFLQQELEIQPEPFEKAGSIQILQDLVQKGVIRKVAAVADHKKLGYAANGMFCAKISADQAEEIGTELARDSHISHCYVRTTFPGWDYNLFAMIHERSDEQLQNRIDQIIRAMNMDNYALLRTVREFKKEPVKIRF